MEIAYHGITGHEGIHTIFLAIYLTLLFQAAMAAFIDPTVPVFPPQPIGNTFSARHVTLNSPVHFD